MQVAIKEIALGYGEPDLSQILQPKWNGFILYNICQGMAHISEKGIIHQDLKPANIMVEHPTNKAIICDLGVGKFGDATHATHVGGNPGTLAYQHAEQLAGKAPTAAADVYSFAVIMVEVYTRIPVWRGNTSNLQKAIMVDNAYPSYDSADIPAVAKDLIALCFRSAQKRPTFVSLLPSVRNLVGDVDIW